MKIILANFILIFIYALASVQNAFIYAGCSTVIGIIIFLVCISIFGGWGLISLIFILPSISKAVINGKHEEMREKNNRDEDIPF